MYPRSKSKKKVQIITPKAMLELERNKNNINSNFKNKFLDFKKKLQEDQIAKEKQNKAKAMKVAQALLKRYEPPKDTQPIKPKSRIYDPNEYLDDFDRNQRAKLQAEVDDGLKEYVTSYKRQQTNAFKPKSKGYNNSDLSDSNYSCEELEFEI